MLVPKNYGVLCIVPTLKLKFIVFSVLLQAPPGNLKLESPHNQLTWLPPTKPHSMLSYVLTKIMSVEYKLECKVQKANKHENSSNDWQVGFKRLIGLFC